MRTGTNIALEATIAESGDCLEELDFQLQLARAEVALAQAKVDSLQAAREAAIAIHNRARALRG